MAVDFFEGIKCSLGIQRIETGLYEDGVHTAVDKSANLFVISLDHVPETVRTLGRIVDVRRQAQRLGGRPHAAEYQNLASRGPAGDTGSFQCQGIGQCLCSVFFLGYAVGTECISFDYIGSCSYIFLMDFFDYFRMGDVQAFIVSLQFMRIFWETFMEVFLCQIISLNHGTHSSVEHQDTVLQCRFVKHNDYL